MPQLLMPRATAVWLIENTALSFHQIAEFCSLHELEVQAIADGEVAAGMVGMDPVASGQLSQAEIDRCTADPTARLHLSEPNIPLPASRSKGPRYTPVTKRGDKPDAIAWLLKHHPELSDTTVTRLIGTTKPTINAVRDRTHWNSSNIKARDPVLLGLCTQSELNEAVAKARQNRPAAYQQESAPEFEEEEEGSERLPEFADAAPRLPDED